MADDHAAVAQEMSVGARIGGASMVVTWASVAHAFSHAYGALLPLILPFFLAGLQLTYTPLGLVFSLAYMVWNPLQLGSGRLGRDYSRQVILGRIADATQHPICNALISQGFHADRRGLA